MMRFRRSPLEEFISAAAFYSTLFASKCQADEIPGYLWQQNEEDDEFVRVFKTDIPWTPMDLQKRRQDFALVAWIAVITVAVIIAIIVCACCLFWRIFPKYGSRRQSSNAALVPPPTNNNARVFSRMDPVADRGRSDSAIADNTYNPGVMNFAFTRDLPDPLVGVQDQERPPAYLDVVSQTSPYDKPTNMPYPEVTETKFVETPPPTYLTVAPFQ